MVCSEGVYRSWLGVLGVPLITVPDSHHDEDETTWEREEELRIEFPHLFPRSS
jgi:hypothetical protein